MDLNISFSRSGIFNISYNLYESKLCIENTAHKTKQLMKWKNKDSFNKLNLLFSSLGLKIE